MCVYVCGGGGGGGGNANRMNFFKPCHQGCSFDWFTGLCMSFVISRMITLVITFLHSI